MKSNKNAIRLLLMLLTAGILISCFAACKKPVAQPDVTSSVVTADDATSAPEVETESPFLFDQTFWDEDFYFLRPANQYKNFYFTDVGSDDPDIITTQLYLRDALVEEYLGVTVHSRTKDNLSETELVTEIRNQNLLKMFDFDAALTHNYLGITTMVSEGLLSDFYAMEDIDLEAPWWNIDVVKTLEVKGKAYFALNDFMINNTCAVFFNKGMMQQFNINEDLYELVRDGKWTIDKMFELTKLVSVENGDGVWDKFDTYGLGMYADWYPLQLVDSCNVQWLTPGPGFRALTMSARNARYVSVYEKIKEIANAESTYMWNYGDSENRVKITDGRFLFTFAPVRESYTYPASNVSFGFLPYPKYDVEQEEYYSTEWSGMLCVPKEVKNDRMVAQTLDCLAAFSTTTVRPAYYERLLGKRIAEEYDDAEMIEKYIFGNIVLNPAITYETKANEPLGILVYTIAKMLRYTLNKTYTPDIAENWESYGGLAQEQIDLYLN